MTAVAACMIRDLPHYRRDAFVRGLQAAGKRIVPSVGAAPKSLDDWLVIWNRYGEGERLADLWESRGGTVLVCENGYLGTDSEGRQLYAIAIHGHNGSGRWFVGDEDRTVTRSGLPSDVKSPVARPRGWVPIPTATG